MIQQFGTSTTFWKTLQHFETRYNILEHVTTFWNTLQHFETRNKILEHVTTFGILQNSLEHVRTVCNN